MRNEHHSCRGTARNRCEIAQRVIAGVRIQMRIDRHRTLVRKNYCVAIGRRLRCECSADVALRACTIVDDDLLSKIFGELRCEYASECIGPAAGWERNDEADRL